MFIILFILNLNLFKNLNFCKSMIKQNDGFVLKFVHENMKTYEICKLAVQQDGLALEFVCTNIQTEEICKIAILRDINALKFIKNNLEFIQILVNLHYSNPYINLPVNNFRTCCYKYFKFNMCNCYNLPKTKLN